MTASLEPWNEIHNAMSRKEILAHMNSHGVRFLRLQFTDITGINKNVEVPASQFEKALDGEILFDGSSIEGFTRIEESDMVLVPDYSTYRVEPFASLGSRGKDHGRIARLICDVHNPDGSPFIGCPRLTLKRQCEAAAELGFECMAGPEAEFFLFVKKDGEPTTETHDGAGYFDLAPVDLGEECRREIVLVLEAMGFAPPHCVVALKRSGNSVLRFRGCTLAVASAPRPGVHCSCLGPCSCHRRATDAAGSRLLQVEAARERGADGERADGA